MSSRRKGDSEEKIYAAAQAWVDSALRSDDSLFTPGKRIWTLEGLTELRTQVSDRPDGSRDRFPVKLRRQLEGSRPEVYQLMAEVLFVHSLISGNSKGDTKRDLINQVLGWSPEPVSMPQALADCLDVWFMNISASSANRDAQVGTQIEVIEQWKQLQPEERTRILEDAWAFKEFVFSRHFISERLANHQNTGRIEKEMLLHIAFPDEFETIGTRLKVQIANAAGFADFVTEPTDDVDRRLQQIRQGLTATRGDFNHFWEDGIREVWAHGQPLNGDADTRILEVGQQLSDEGEFTSSNEPEARDKIDASIARRRGQHEFRNKLLDTYGKRCAITGCDAVEALEAAHIRQYKEADLNDATNGLLLRADIHTLFDRHLIGIDPVSGNVWIGKLLKGTTYAELEDTEASPPKKKDRPDPDALREHREKARELGRFN